MSILITGGAGFIGSNFTQYWAKRGVTEPIFVLDLMTYAASERYLEGIQDAVTLIKGDIADFDLVRSVVHTHNVQTIVHFAAESHVDNSIQDPLAFVRTNVLGTAVLLEAARREWMDAPFQVRKSCRGARFLHVSTDEVYGTLGQTGAFSEQSLYAPNSPYSASKAGSDHLVRSYVHTYGMNCVTTNCSNNYGPHQHPEKLIPTIIRSAVTGQSIPIYGSGLNVRDWLFVTDHCSAIASVLQNGIAGETYLIGSRNEWPNIQIADAICDLLDQIQPRGDGQSYRSQIAFVTDRPGHDLRYAIDPSKIEQELGWRPETDFPDGLEQTIRWYLTHYDWV